MQRRQLFFLHAVLSLAAVLLAMRLAGEWKRANLRYGIGARQETGGAAYLAPSLPERPAPSSGEIVAKNLFTPDRNNERAQEATARPNLGLPIVFGTMNLGGGYEALMAESRQPTNRNLRRVKAGEQVGGYTVLEIQDEKVVVEFQGRRTTLDVYQSARSVSRPAARSAPPVAPVVETVESAPPQPAASPQPRPAPTAAAPQSGSKRYRDATTRVTRVGNRLRVERQTPFGPQVWYENIEE